MTVKVIIETYPNFKQIVLSKDGASHFLYLLNAAFYDPSFTSAPDAEEPMVMINLDISNAFGTLFSRLVLDHLSGKASRVYACGINADADFETAVHGLKAYFVFFRLQRTCETILRFYSYDGATNYVRCRTGGLQGDCPEFMTFCLVTLHLWGRIFGKFPEIKGLAYADDGNIIAKLSTALKLISMLAPVFKKDANLVFDIRKTKVLAKGPSQTICLNAQNISSTPTLTLQILLTTSHGTCSRQRVSKYLELRWAMTVSFRPL